MELPYEDRIMEILEGVDEAMTYGEVLAELMGKTSYFVSMVVNNRLSKHPPKRLELFFGNYWEADNVMDFYRDYFLPIVRELQADNVLSRIKISEKKRSYAHTNFVSDFEEKLDRRMEREIRRKKDIMPELLSIADEIVEEVARVYPTAKSAALQGSASPKNDKPFIYYGDTEEIKSVSNLDIRVFVRGPAYIGKIRSFLDELSGRKKIPADVSFTKYDLKTDEAIERNDVLLSFPQ